MGRITVVNTGVRDESLVPERVDRLVHDSSDRGFFRLTFGFLVGRFWEIVITDTYGGSPGSCPYETDDGGDPGHLTGWTVG